MKTANILSTIKQGRRNIRTKKRIDKELGNG
jgi:hypothetical protein